MPVNLAPKRLNTLSVSRRGKCFQRPAPGRVSFVFNTAWHWGEREEQAVKQLGSLIREMLRAKSLV
ncbi:GntR family transcriptional regulator [Salmonella enterica subsp. enterica serovar Daytona]|uniref:GntR family transcriptional regulator n=1 Tax=Salmonella enterica subsp. enterica serovar Daytona TaxID=1962639 RepID=A0A447JIA5_SALET|nr:GntR family transcriptional regulator [Salmonella enterica subsp. enterica serovar Daytona]